MILNLNNLQRKAIVVSANQTAVNDANYTVVANSTFTDPSPIEGKGYRVFVRNGTATINSVAYTVGTSVLRLFHSGSWVSYVSLPDSNFVASNTPITGATKTKITYDAKGLVTGGADATTADIADSINKRYVTDANLVVIGNTSGTNTGDETESSILSKLGWWRIHETTSGSNSSGTSNTISKSIQIGTITDILNIDKVTFTKTGTGGTFTARVYLSEVENNIGGTAILLGTALTTNANNLYLSFERLHEKIGSNICGINASSSANSDRIQSGSARLNTAILTASPLYLIFATQCTNLGDVARFESGYIKNF
jgi:hypothetical protein